MSPFEHFGVLPQRSCLSIISDEHKNGEPVALLADNLSMIRFKYRPQSAFTLLELLVTILIIGVLSTLALAGFQTIQKRALRMQCASNLRQIGLAIQQYASENDNSLPGPAWVSLPFDVKMFGSMQGYNQMGVFLAPYLMERSINPTDPPLRCNAFVSPMYSLKRKWGNPPTYHYIRPSDTKRPFGDQSGSTIYPPLKIVALPGVYGKNLSEIWSIQLHDATLQNGRNVLFFDGHAGWYPTGTPLP